MICPCGYDKECGMHCGNEHKPGGKCPPITDAYKRYRRNQDKGNDLADERYDAKNSTANPQESPPPTSPREQIDDFGVGHDDSDHGVCNSLYLICGTCSARHYLYVSWWPCKHDKSGFVSQPCSCGYDNSVNEIMSLVASYIEAAAIDRAIEELSLIIDVWYTNPQGEVRLKPGSVGDTIWNRRADLQAQKAVLENKQ